MSKIAKFKLRGKCSAYRANTVGELDTSSFELFWNLLVRIFTTFALTMSAFTWLGSTAIYVGYAYTQIVDFVKSCK